MVTNVWISVKVGFIKGKEKEKENECQIRITSNSWRVGVKGLNES